MSTLAYTMGSRVFDENNSVVLVMDDNSKIRVLLRDGYWILLLFADFVYEPEVAFVLGRVLSRSDACFIDCGANIGYWSAVAAGIMPRPGVVVAIEASPFVFQQLTENCAMSSGHIDCLSAAVWSHDGETLEIIGHDRRHAGSSVVSRREKRHQTGYQVDKVQSLSLDTVCERYIVPGFHVVLKLDVEGAEIMALDGAEKLLSQHDCLIVYEDHGNDQECLVSQYVINELKMDVYYCDDLLKMRHMASVEAIRRIKVDARRGYNFFACAPESGFKAELDALIDWAEQSS